MEKNYLQSEESQSIIEYFGKLYCRKTLSSRLKVNSEHKNL